jgi:AcrR family transcriptional regulator
MPKGSFYNYFPSKEDFSAEVVRHYVEPFIRQLDAHLSASNTAADAALRNYSDELIAETERTEFKAVACWAISSAKSASRAIAARPRCATQFIAIAKSCAKGSGAVSVSARISGPRTWPTFWSMSGREPCCA